MTCSRIAGSRPRRSKTRPQPDQPHAKPGFQAPDHVGRSRSARRRGSDGYATTPPSRWQRWKPPSRHGDLGAVSCTTLTAAAPTRATRTREVLNRIGAVVSMSRTGDCWDNAVAESFFGTLRAELLDHERYETRAEAKAALQDYIEGFYNPRRRHSSTGYMSPMEYELRSLSASRAA